MVKIEQSNGTISITNEVFTNLAGDAATSCFGVKGMVGRSKDSGPFQLLRRESMSKGVNATFADDGSISLELHIAVDHGVNISALAHSIINEVSYKVNQATGVPVARANGSSNVTAKIRLQNNTNSASTMTDRTTDMITSLSPIARMLPNI